MTTESIPTVIVPLVGTQGPPGAPGALAPPLNVVDANGATFVAGHLKATGSITTSSDSSVEDGRMYYWVDVDYGDLEVTRPLGRDPYLNVVSPLIICTQAEYDAIAIKNPFGVYLIKA